MLPPKTVVTEAHGVGDHVDKVEVVVSVVGGGLDDVVGGSDDVVGEVVGAETMVVLRVYAID